MNKYESVIIIDPNMNKEETLKVDISNNVDDNLFEIPSDYEEG